MSITHMLIFTFHKSKGIHRC